MSSALRERVRERANGRCEYCQLHVDDVAYSPFHLDHVIAKKHKGPGDFDNLCWACFDCNLFKGTDIAGLIEGRVVRLFNPRTQHWSRHFEWEHTILIGKTNAGIVTVDVLRINHSERIQVRENLFFEGRFPPPS